MISEHIDPRGKPYYWIGEVREGFRAEGGTDFEAVDEGYVSVTPMRSDLTNHAAIKLLESWNSEKYKKAQVPYPCPFFSKLDQFSDQ